MLSVKRKKTMKKLSRKFFTDAIESGLMDHKELLTIGVLVKECEDDEIKEWHYATPFGRVEVVFYKEDCEDMSPWECYWFSEGYDMSDDLWEEFFEWAATHKPEDYRDGIREDDLYFLLLEDVRPFFKQEGLDISFGNLKNFVRTFENVVFLAFDMKKPETLPALSAEPIVETLEEYWDHLMGY